MSPRRNYPKPRGRRPKDGDDEDARSGLSPDLVTGAPPGWQARVITAERALKEYVCPDCNQRIAPGIAHVVAWQSDREEHRRHWHKGCWERARRSLR